MVMKVVNCLKEEAENGAAESYPFEMIEVIKEEVCSIELYGREQSIENTL